MQKKSDVTDTNTALDNKSEDNAISRKDVVKLIFKNIMAHKKAGIIFATMYGFFYLFCYAAEQNTPLPIAEPTFPVLLISLAAGVVAIVIMLLSMINFPAILTGDDFKNIYSDHENFRSKENKLTFLKLTGSPLILLILATCLLIWVPGFKKYETGLFLGSMGIGFVVSMIFAQMKIKRFFSQEIWIIFLFNLFIIVAISGFLVFFTNVYKFESSPDALLAVLYLSIIILLYFWSYILSFPNSYLVKKIETHRISIVFSIVFMAFFIQLNAPIFKLSLKVAKIGGGYERVFHFTDEQEKKFPKELIVKDEKKTKRLLVFYNWGNTIYVKLKDSDDGRVFVLNSDNIAYEEIPGRQKTT